MDYIAFVPVRGGSKSIPKKNIKLFCGKPLVYWVLKAAVDCDRIKKVVLATDSLEIINCVNGLGLDKIEIYNRKPENAQDNSTTESVMLEYIDSQKQDLAKGFVLIQATSPLLTSKDLNRGIDMHSNYNSVLSCVRSKRFYWNDNGTPINYNFKKRPRRQDFDGTWVENGAFYISAVSRILESENRISGNIGILEMPEHSFIEIDEEDDWIIAEKLMSKHISKANQGSKIKLLLSDVDGVLTDAGMYYSEKGDELKKFNTRDGMAFQLLREASIKVGIVTSENTKIVERRAEKLKVDFLVQGKMFDGKLAAAKSIVSKLGIELDEVAYIGDDINCLELLKHVGLAACPSDASLKIKEIPGILILSKKGGEGVVRELVDDFIL